MLIRVFGRNSVALVSYDTVIESGGDIFRHFTRHFLGTPNLLSPKKMRSNVSVPTALAELRRILNVFEQEAGLARSGHMAILLQKRTDINLGKILSYIDGFKRLNVLADNREPIIYILRQARLEYADCLTPQVKPGTIYLPKVASAQYITPDYLLAPSFSAAVRSLRDELLK